MDSASENMVALGPAVFTAVFIGLIVIIFTFLVKWIKQEDSQEGNAKNEKLDKTKNTSSDASGKHGKKEQTGTVKQSSKKKLTERENRRTARATEKGFSHPWLIATLKGHSGRVLDMDFSANGKYLASCGDEDPDPGGLSSTTTDSSSSSSESNKENSLPSSQSPSPIMNKGLSRRQRKNNRKREHTQAVVIPKIEPEVEIKESKDSINKTQKKNKNGSKKNIVPNGGPGAKHQQQRLAQEEKAVSDYRHLDLKPLEEYNKLSMSEQKFASLLAINYSLRQENMAKLGYPVRPSKRIHIDKTYQLKSYHVVMENSMYYYNFAVMGAENHCLDVHAEEFVPKCESGDSGNGTEGSGSSSEEDSSSSEGSEDLSSSPPPKLAIGTINRKDVHYRICVRCGSFFYTTSKKYITLESCRYHWGKIRTLNHGYGPLEYTCCNGSSDSVGCAVGKLHVWNGPVEPNVNSSFVETEPPKSRHPHNSYCVVSLDCEMSYTVVGLEVVKVSVVDMRGLPVYNEFVKPKNEIVDFNTRFSGITETDFIKNNPKPLSQVQREIKKLISSDTVLIGHGLENDLKGLKLIHRTIVDTSYSFPHYKGFPFRRSLKSLTKTYLKRDIQCSQKGHDSFEDARACMELMLFRLRRDIETCGYVDEEGYIRMKKHSSFDSYMSNLH